MSQANAILTYMKKHTNGITPIEALEEFRCFRLAARIKDMRNEGKDIMTAIEHKNGKRYARYILLD